MASAPRRGTHRRSQGTRRLRKAPDRFVEVVPAEEEGLSEAVFRAAPDAIFVSGDEGTLVDVNPAACRLLGYPREEILGRALGSFAERAGDTSAPDLLSPGEGAGPGEIRLRRADGTVLDAEYVAAQEILPGRHLAILRDITPWRRAADSVKESEGRYRLLFEKNPQPMWVFDRETLRFLSVNDAAIAKYGWSREEFLGMTIRDIRPKEDLPALEKELARTPAGPSMPGLWRHRKKDGTLIWVEISAGDFVVEGRAARLIAAKDVTEQRRAEDEVRERVAQQAAVAMLGMNALSTEDLDTLMDGAVHLVAATLRVERVGVFELDARTKTLTLRAGIGWEGDLVPGQAAPADSQAAYTLSRGEPVSAEDLGSGTWYRSPAPVGAGGPSSGLSVLIHLKDRPFGVLVAHPAERRRFTANDVNFLQSTANVIAAAIDRKRAVDGVVAAERRFRLMIERASDVVGLIGPDLRFLHVGPSAALVLGYPPDELVGHRALDFFHPEDLDRALARLTELLATPGGTAEEDLRFRHKDGTWRWLHALGTNLLSEPAVGAIVVNARDITDRKLSEQILRESEERFRSIFQESPMGIALVAPDLRILAVNRAYCQMLLHTETELLGMSFPDVAHPEDAAMDGEFARRLFAREVPAYTSEIRCVRKNGTLLWCRVTATAVRNERGEPLYAVRVAEDITAAKSAELELERSERKFRTIFESAADPIFLVDKTGLILDANPVAAGLLREERARIVGQNLGDVVPVPDRERARKYFVDVVKGRPVQEPFSVTIQPPGSDPRHLEVRSRAVRAPDRKTLVEVVARDVTDQREIQQRLIRSERLASLGQISAYIAHQINTPLTNISLIAAGIGRLTQDQGVLERVEKINRQRRHAAKIISDLMRFSKHRALALEEMDLRDVVAVAVDQVAPYRKAEVDLRVAVGDAPVVLRMDPLQIQELLVNLLKNALEATVAGHVSIHLEDRGDVVGLTVEDTGVGIPAENLARLFEPFFTTKGTGEGTGLGLSLCQNIVAAHSGRIGVESHVGKGTQFRVVLPRGTPG